MPGLIYTSFCTTRSFAFQTLLVSLPSRIHKYRSRNDIAPPVGFHFTARYTMRKYGLLHLWREIKTNVDTKIKNMLKKSIWLHHWKADISAALASNTFFASVFLKNKSPPAHPYKGHPFLTSLHTHNFPRIAIARILRFWLTPARVRVCTYAVPIRMI